MNQQRQRPGLGIPSAGIILRKKRALGTSVDPNLTTTLTQLAPVAKALFNDDPTEDVETLKAKIRNHKRMRDGFPRGTLLWTFYDNKIAVLTAKLRAALVAQKEQVADRASVTQWGELGKTATVVSLVIGGTIIALLVNLTGAAGRANRSRA